jgi:type II secretory pathway pseudopilin PulG
LAKNPETAILMNDQPSPAIPPQPAAFANPQKTSGLAVASLVFGIISLMGAAILIVPVILAVVFGHVSLAKIRRDRNLGGSGMAITGLVLGYVSIVFGVLMAGLLAAMAIPAFVKVREASLQKAMQNDARQIGSAAQQYMIDKGVTTVSFDIDPATGRVTGPLSEYSIKITPGTRAVDGVIANPEDTFSLQNPRVAGGDAIIFDAEGRPR